MSKLMTAESALEMSHSSCNEVISVQINDINKKITEKANKGERYFFYHKSINEFVRAKLKNSGFIIEGVDGWRNDYYYKISW